MRSLLDMIGSELGNRVGEAYFEALVEQLSKALAVDHVFVGVLEGRDRVRSIAVYRNGGPAEAFAYGLAGTPCREVIEGNTCLHRKGVAERFPQDRMLAARGIEGYAGVPLRGARGETIGLIVAMSERPLHDPNLIASVLRLSGDRAAAELERRVAEVNIRQNEARLRAIVDNLPVGFYLKDRSEQYTLVNKAYLAWTGESEAALTGRSPAEWEEAGEADAFVRQETREDREVLATGRAISATRERRFGSGEVRSVLLKRFPVLDDAGLVSAVGVVAMDISDLVRTRTQLQAREFSLRKYHDALLRIVRSELLAEVDLATVIPKILEIAASTLGVSFAAAWEVDEERKSYRCLDVWDQVALRHGKRDALVFAEYPEYAAALERDKVIDAGDALRDPRTAEFTSSYLEPLGIRAVLDISVQAGEEIRGVLSFDHCGEPRQWSVEEVTFARSVADLIAIAFISQRHRQTLQDLARAEADYRRLYNQAPVLMYTVDKGFRIDSVGDHFLKRMGYQRDEVLGRVDMDFLTSASRSVVDERRERVLQTGAIENVEVGYVTRENKVIEAQATAIAEFDDIGELRRIHVAATDISERKRAERELEASRRQLLRAQALGQVGYWAFEPETGRVRWSEQLFKITGVAPADDVSFPGVREASEAFWALIHPDDLSRFTEERAAAIVDGRPFVCEFRIVRADGDVRWVHQEIYFQGEPIGTIHPSFGVLQDITESKLAEQAVRDSESRLRALVENLSDVVMVVTVQGEIGFVSPSVVEVLGRRPEDLRGNSLLDLVHKDDAPDLRWRMLEMVAHADGSLTTRFRVRHSDGSWRQLAAVIKNASATPGVDGLLINARDVTQSLRLEEQLRQAMKMEVVGQLTGGVAHDFNNLLAVVMGNLELLDEKLDEESGLKRYAATAIRAAERGASLTQRLLAFSRRQSLEPEPTDVDGLVKEMTDLLRRTLGETIEVRTQLAAGTRRAMVDPGQLENALLNLAVNARDAMPRGGVLSIETRQADLDASLAEEHDGIAPGPYVQLSVTDTGVGMPPDVADRVFEPFFTTKEIGKGSGLGLSMVYGFAKQSGGDVSVTSAVGRGTTMSIYLAAAPAENLAPAPIRSHNLPVASRQETVLLVEDEPEVRRLAVDLLELLGYRVVAAGDGPQALDRLAQMDRIDLLLTDVVLPHGMDGLDLARRVRAQRAQTRVLFMSGYADNALLRDGLPGEGVFLIGKPFLKAELAHKLREALAAPPSRL